MSIQSDFSALCDGMLSACEARTMCRREIHNKVKYLRSDAKSMVNLLRDMSTERKKNVAEMRKEIAGMLGGVRTELNEARKTWSDTVSKMRELRTKC